MYLGLVLSGFGSLVGVVWVCRISGFGDYGNLVGWGGLLDRLGLIL